MTPSRSRRTAMASLIFAALAPAAALAQDAAYPTKPITIIVPFSAGGGVDVMARPRWKPSSKSSCCATAA